MTLKQQIPLLCTILLTSVFATSGKANSGNILQLPAGQQELTLRQMAMPELGQGRLAKILTRYYQEGLGGPENWERISSLKVSGILKLQDGDYEFSAFQKKPNLIKMTIRANQRDLVLAYDGETAWRDFPQSGSGAQPMSSDEARRFIHSALFGNYLLHPFAAGKQIEYMDTVPMEGAICHKIRVTLDTGYQIDYFIDIRSYLEVKVINTDLHTEKTNTIIYTDYVREEGMPIAKQVESYEDGEWSSSLRLEAITINAGIIPWMFEMRPAKSD
jgi:hypothetical protein